MAIYYTDMETGEIRPLSAAEIKAEIQRQTGWTTAQYQKEYDKLRNRLRNYEAAIGQSKPRAVNEELFKIVKYGNTTGLTLRQQAILKFSSASTKSFRHAAEENRLSSRLESIAINSLVNGSFRDLLDKSETTRIEFETWKNEIVDHERIKLPNGQYGDRPITRAEKGVTAREVNHFLGQQAKDLHKRQKREYEANKEFYERNSSYPGSD